MKRLIFLLISGITALPILAQLNGDGYYRIQNTSNYGRYLTISNNKVDETNKNAIKRGEEGNVYGLKTINDAVSDPSSIVYISKDNTAKSNNAYNIQAQGINPLKFLKDNGAELKIYPEGKGYFLYGSKDAITLYLYDNTFLVLLLKLLDYISQQLSEVLYQQRVIRDENRIEVSRRIASDKNMLNTLKALENRQSNIEEYSRLSTNYSEAAALFSLATYLKQ